MKVLLLNQCFYPDVAATAQYLTDLAVELTQRGHKVTALASRRGYDNPAVRFSGRENWRGVEIIRIASLSPGKETRWRRALNFGSFLLSAALRLALLPRFDVVIGLTSPPLISFLGALFVQLKGGRLFVWVMDLNPDEAIAAGWLNAASVTARALESFLSYSLRKSERVIVLDRFVKQRILARGIAEGKALVSPPWSLNNNVSHDQKGREAFRDRHGLAEKFVVMYAGNHSPCHPLATLLDAAQRLSDREEIVFCFVGGGSEFGKVKRFAEEQHLKNIYCLPYQPIEQLSGSLSAADLHVVVMGERFVGIIHPCKIYNVLTVGTPFLYIGPEESHITDIIKESENKDSIYVARHGDAEAVANQILAAAARRTKQGPETEALRRKFSREARLPGMTAALECVATAPSVSARAVSQTSV